MPSANAASASACKCILSSGIECAQRWASSRSCEAVDSVCERSSHEGAQSPLPSYLRGQRGIATAFQRSLGELVENRLAFNIARLHVESAADVIASYECHRTAHRREQRLRFAQLRFCLHAILFAMG